MKKTIITTSMLALFAGAVFAESYVFDSSNPNGFIPLESGSLEMTINDGAKLATIHTTSATGVVDNVSIVLNGGSTGIIWGAGKGVVSGDVNMKIGMKRVCLNKCNRHKKIFDIRDCMAYCLLH